MKKRLLWPGAILLAIGFAIAYLHPVTYFGVVGLLKRESFYAGRPTSYWVSALKKDESAFILAERPRFVDKILNDAGAEAHPVLLEMLTNPDPRVRWQALFALNLTKPDPGLLKQRLPDLLADENFEQICYVANGLLSTIDKEALLNAFLRKFKESKSAHVRAGAIRELSWRAPSDPRVLAAIQEGLHDQDAEVRLQAMLPLLRRRDEQTIQLLQNALKDDDGKVRGFAATALRQLASKAKSSLPALRATLNDEDPSVRVAAAAAVWSVQRDASEVVPTLVAIIRQQKNVRSDRDFGEPVSDALLVLRTIGPAAKSALPELLEMCQEKRPPESAEALALALVAIAPECKEAVGMLTEILDNEDTGSRLLAAQALAELGPKANAAVPALRKIVQNRSNHSRWRAEAAFALAKIVPSPAGFSDLVTLLIDDNPPLRNQAMSCLLRLGPQAKGAVPALMEKLSDRGKTRFDVVLVLHKIGADPKLLVQPLISLLKANETGTRSSALGLLGELGGQAREAIPFLIQLWFETGADFQTVSMAVTVLAPFPTNLVSAVVASADSPPDPTILHRSVGQTIKRIDPSLAAKMGIGPK